MIKINSGSNASILSVGIYRATNLVPNSAIVEKIDSTDEWIQQRTGIETRRFADKNISVVDMGTAAAKQALDRAKVTSDQVDVDGALKSGQYMRPRFANGTLCRCNARAIDQAMQGAERFDRRIDRRLHLRGAGDIGKRKSRARRLKSRNNNGWRRAIGLSRR